MKRLLLFTLLICVIVAGSLCYADTNETKPLKLADVFGEGMVLQQKEVNNIWGKTKPFTVVTLEIQHKKIKTKSDINGDWKLKVKGLKPGGPYQMKINSGENSILYSDIYVGEVWLASGQSNMERRLSMSNNGKEVVKNAKNTNIRFLKVPYINYEGQKVKKSMKWQTATAPQVGDMSAVGYYFAEKLQKELNVPVGIICCYKGGVAAETWMNEKTLEENPVLKPILDNYYETAIMNDEEYNKKMEEYKSLFRIYNDSVKLGYRNAVRPFEPVGPKHHKRPCGLYHTMLERIIPYSVKGVIWYQGEGNAERGAQYRVLFPALINQWRKDFDRPNLPFYFVQLSNFDHPFWQDQPYWAELRDAQLFTWKTVKNTAMVVTMDKGEKDNLHPAYKRPVGERLAACAMNKIYKRNNPYSGPVYKKMTINKDKIELCFDFVYSGLAIQGDELKGFTICAQDRKFIPAKAEIENNKVYVYSDQIKNPVAVRYGWSNWSDCNLFNKEGFPATPFRTDDFNLITENIYYPIKIR